MHHTNLPGRHKGGIEGKREEGEGRWWRRQGREIRREEEEEWKGRIERGE